jgi:hypothetical protein
MSVVKCKAFANKLIARVRAKHEEERRQKEASRQKSFLRRKTTELPGSLPDLSLDPVADEK